jgi:transcriptional regulator with XRE-family HTH domain
MPRKPNPPPATFGARLAALRKAAGYTQVELAEVTGLSQRMVCYYETQDDHPIVRVLRHFALALGVSADELLGLAPMRPKGAHRQQRGKRKRRESIL